MGEDCSQRIVQESYLGTFDEPLEDLAVLVNILLFLIIYIVCVFTHKAPCEQFTFVRQTHSCIDPVFDSHAVDSFAKAS